MHTTPASQRAGLTALMIVLVASLAAGLPGRRDAHAAAPAAEHAAAAQAPGNPIPAENANPGTDQWQLYWNNRPVSDDVNRQIQGYASATSVNKGSSITFHITVNPAQTYTIDIYRLGFYGGLGGRLMQRVGARAGTRQAECPINSSTGMVECGWSASYTLVVPGTWTTGVYNAILTNAAGYRSLINFVVRDDSRVADFLYQQPVLTYQAYNNWPAGTTRGKSLYDYNSSGANTVAGSPRAVKVSFDRPTTGQFGTLDNDFSWEANLVYWLEQNGYDVSYTTNVDTHLNGARLLTYKGFFSTGHDEYWTREMYDNVVAARNAGVNLAFWGANALYWQVRLEASSRGTANRVVVGYKDAALDPTTDPTRETILWRQLNRPEQTLIGVQYSSDHAALVTQPLITQNTTHWAYAGSGLTDNTRVPRLIGYEVDRLFAEYAKPISTSYTLLSTSPFTASNGAADLSQSAIYQAPSGAWVFGSGTMSWSWALSRPGMTSAGIQRVTRNILERFLLRGQPTPTALPSATATATRTSTPTPAPPTATATATRTPTPAPGPTATATLVPATATSTASATATSTSAPTSTATAAAVFTATPATACTRLSRTGWTLNPWTNPTAGTLTVDGNPASIWNSGIWPAAGQYFGIDLGAVTTINGLLLDTSGDPANALRNYVLSVSADGGVFTQIATGALSGNTALISFAPTQARYISLQPASTDFSRTWSIGEIDACSGGATQPTATATPTVATQATPTPTVLATHTATATPTPGPSATPANGPACIALARTGWTANPFINAGAGPQAIDAASTTFWNSGLGQNSGQYFGIDLGARVTVGGIRLDASADPANALRGYVVKVSPDGGVFTPVATGTLTSSVALIAFTPVQVQYVSVEPTTPNFSVTWSLGDYSVCSSVQS